MKKITFLLMTVCMVLFSAQAQKVTTVWEHSKATNSLVDLAGLSAGSWSTATVGGTARKFAVGTMNGNERVYIFTRSGANGVVLIYDAEDGAYVGKMEGSTVGGLVSIGDGDVTEDGKLILSNVSNAANAFKVYMWEAENQDPTVLFTYTTPDRYGDNLFVTGDYDAGTAKIYAAKKAAGYGKVLCWSMEADIENPGKFKFNETPEETINAFATNTAANVCTLPSGGLYYKDSGFYGGKTSTPTVIAEYDAAGDSINSTPNDLIAPHGVAPRFVGPKGGDQILTYFKYYHHASNAQAPAGEEQDRAELVLVPGGDLSQATPIAVTPSLGNEKNLNGWGKVVAKQIDESNIELYVFSSYNGFGKFTVDLDAEPDPEPEPDIQTVWEHSNAKGNIPSPWTYRKIAVGDLGSGKRVFTAVGTGTVRVYDDADGTYVKDLTGSITNAAALAIGDLGVTKDGVLLVSNVANASQAFQVYKWDSEASNPVKVIDVNTLPYRYGDNIFVEGDYSKGTAKVYATGRSGYATTPVYRWSMELVEGAYKFKSTPDAVFDAAGGSIPWAGVSTFPSGYYYKDGGSYEGDPAPATRLHQFDSNGVLIGTANPGIVTRHSNTPRFIAKDGDDHIVALHRYNAKANDGECRAEFFRLPDGDIDEIESIDMTPSLGNAANINGWGDIVPVVEKNASNENEAFVYVSSVSNGFAKYNVTKLFQSPEGPTVSVKPQAENGVVVRKTTESLIISGVDNPSVEIYNLLGQSVLSAKTNHVNISNLSGLYIVNVKENGQSVKTVKFIF